MKDIINRTRIGKTWVINPMEFKIIPKISKEDKKPVLKCHKCGRTSHLANTCIRKTKINEVEVIKDVKCTEEEEEFEKYSAVSKDTPVEDYSIESITDFFEFSQPWQFTSLDLRKAYQATVLLLQIGHIHHQWPIWPCNHPMGHLSFGAFMALHLNPEGIAAIYAQMGIYGNFPQNQGKWPKWLFLAIWAHNLHLRICTLLRTLMQSVQKTLFCTLGQFLAQKPKVAKNPRGPRNTFPSSETITSIFFPSVFPSQGLWT
ncbi:hypothetical protein O181_124511 [Austropuccinia psidii MF-1]|uniref:CCHC-type domain-containing protein n=1 Tax=Austropuccinia psidii MF-1 TaxID=1389203 RepID=A0A9Q3Q480_9BASI|nr:hypothetical protein [Austropuccinia psidii MF-1]